MGRGRVSARYTEANFWKQIEFIPFHECWEWVGPNSGSKSPYGTITINGKTKKAHRLSWEIHHKACALPKFDICHSCDNSACVNPKHLWIGTTAENMRDASKKKRLWMQTSPKTHCKNGHAFSKENTWQEKNGSRHCRECHKLTERKRRMRLASV